MISRRAEEMTPFLVMDVLERARAMERQGINVVHLEVGEPDFDIPAPVREAIAEHYAKRYGVTVDPERIVVCSGTSPAMMLVFSLLLEGGDEAIISDPGYACYPNFIRFSGGVPVPVPVAEADGFQLDSGAVASRITSRTKAIVINSPSNPTGTVLSGDRMEEIADLGVRVISDEIYHGLVYAGRERSILEFSDDAVVLNGFSKLYAMTGLRLGYLIAPPEFIRPIQKMQQNLFICANSVVQRAGIAALREAGEEVERMRRTYDDRRRFMIKRLRKLGFGIASEPTGAFYVFADARHISSDSYNLAFDILEKARVGVAPGIDFGANGEGYLRFSYANSIERIAEGLDRIEGYLEDRKRG